MTAPIFGDPETIKRIDPRRVILDDGIAIPRSVMVCPFCGKQIVARFDDTWVNGDEWGAGTLELCCTDQLDDVKGAIPFWYQRDHEYDTYEGPMRDEDKVTRYLNTLYPNFGNYC